MKKYLTLMIFLMVTILAYSVPKIEETKRDTVDAPKIEETKRDTIDVKDNEAIIVWGDKEILLSFKEVKKVPVFLFSLGFNFDFLEGTKINDLYADMHMDIPTDLSGEKLNIIKGLGYEFRAFQSKTITSKSSFSEMPQLVDSTNNIVKYITANYTGEQKRITENLGGAFQPKFRLYPWKKTDVEMKSHINLMMHLEFARSEININTERELISSDTSFAVIPSSWNADNIVNSLPPNSSDESITEHNRNFGLGLDFHYENEDITFQSKGFLGRNRFKRITEGSDSKKTSYFFLLGTEITENKILGLKFGFEIRGYLPQKIEKNVLGFRSIAGNCDEGDCVPIDRNRSEPFFTVYLAKQFGFRKVADFFDPNK